MAPCDSESPPRGSLARACCPGKTPERHRQGTAAGQEAVRDPGNFWSMSNCQCLFLRVYMIAMTKYNISSTYHILQQQVMYDIENVTYKVHPSTRWHPGRLELVLCIDP